MALVASTGPIALVHDDPAGPAAAAATGWEPEPGPATADPAALPASSAQRDAASSVGASTSWNTFQQRLAGTGLSRAEVASLYAEEQAALRSAAAAAAVGGAGAVPRPGSPRTCRS